MVLSAYALAVIFFWRGKPEFQYTCTEGIAAKLVVPPCDQHMFDSGVDNCLSDFNKSMETSGYQDSCPWPTEIRIYNKLKRCVDDWAKESWCKGHGFLRDTVFLEVHKMYFRLCGQVQDPPSTTLIVLIAPVIIITLFLPILCVKLTTWNTNYVSTFKL